MSDISRLGPVTPPLTVSGQDAAAVRKVATEFEAIFADMLIKSAKLSITGEGSSSLYGDMATSAWSSDIGSGGALGIADLLVRSLMKDEQ